VPFNLTWSLLPANKRKSDHGSNAVNGEEGQGGLYEEHAKMGGLRSGGWGTKKKLEGTTHYATWWVLDLFSCTGVMFLFSLVHEP